jgi:NTP pyrophosphatase (non-canonical NTP hydrolase)
MTEPNDKGPIDHPAYAGEFAPDSPEHSMTMTPSPVSTLIRSRDARQKIVADWCVASFGEGAASSLPQRCVRLLEECIEAYQAGGGDPAMAHKLIDFVFGRPVGELAQEIGGVGLVLLSLANAAGVSADAEEKREVKRVLAKPSSHWAARNANKNAAGFDTSTQSRRATIPVEREKAREAAERIVEASEILTETRPTANEWDAVAVARAYLALLQSPARGGGE